MKYNKMHFHCTANAIIRDVGKQLMKVQSNKFGINATAILKTDVLEIDEYLCMYMRKM